MDEQIEKLVSAIRAGDYDEVEKLACDLFIDAKGHQNYSTITSFERATGYKVFPLESDSFGWLVGGIKVGEQIFQFG